VTEKRGREDRRVKRQGVRHGDQERSRERHQGPGTGVYRLEVGELGGTLVLLSGRSRRQ
jgi:hypothetical protein